MKQLKVTSLPLVLALFTISTGKDVEANEVIREDDKCKAIDSYNVSGVNRRGRVNKKNGTWILPTFLFAVPTCG